MGVCQSFLFLILDQTKNMKFTIELLESEESSDDNGPEAKVCVCAVCVCCACVCVCVCVLCDNSCGGYVYPAALVKLS